MGTSDFNRWSEASRSLANILHCNLPYQPFSSVKLFFYIFSYRHRTPPILLPVLLSTSFSARAHESKATTNTPHCTVRVPSRRAFIRQTVKECSDCCGQQKNMRRWFIPSSITAFGWRSWRKPSSPREGSRLFSQNSHQEQYSEQ